MIPDELYKRINLLLSIFFKTLHLFERKGKTEEMEQTGQRVKMEEKVKKGEKRWERSEGRGKRVNTCKVKKAEKLKKGEKGWKIENGEKRRDRRKWRNMVQRERRK
jgi:hypothetical protein